MSRMILIQAVLLHLRYCNKEQCIDFVTIFYIKTKYFLLLSV